MANSTQAPVKKFGGGYERDFTPVTNALETRLAETNIEHAAVADFPINLRGVFIFGELLKCPNKSVKQRKLDKWVEFSGHLRSTRYQ